LQFNLTSLLGVTHPQESGTRNLLKFLASYASLWYQKETCAR